jgi:hypothetical protein
MKTTDKETLLALMVRNGACIKSLAWVISKPWNTSLRNFWTTCPSPSWLHWYWATVRTKGQHIQSEVYMGPVWNQYDEAIDIAAAKRAGRPGWNAYVNRKLRAVLKKEATFRAQLLGILPKE